MARGHFLNQKLGKVTGRRQGLMKAQLDAERRIPIQDIKRPPKKGFRENSFPSVRNQPSNKSD